MTLKQAIKDPSWLLERMNNQKVEGNDGPGFRHVRCPKMLWDELVRLVEGLKDLESKEVSAGGEPKGGNLQNTDQAHVGRSDAETQPLAAMATDAPSIREYLVEGLKVEEGQQPSKRQIVFNWLMNEDLTKPDGYWGGTEEVERVDALLIALAAQHLKREQEPAPRKWYEYIGKDGRSHWRVAGGNCGCGWTIINDFEWNQHLNREGAERKAQQREQEPKCERMSTQATQETNGR